MRQVRFERKSASSFAWRSLCLAVLLVCCSSASAAANAGYATVPGVPGSSTAPGHAGEIDVLKIDHLIDRKYRPTRGTVKPRVHGPLTIVKMVDRASTKLADACTKGTPLPEVTIHLYRSVGGGEEHYFTIKLTNAQVSSFAMGSDADIPEPVENVSFVYEKIAWTWVPDAEMTEDNWNAE